MSDWVCQLRWANENSQSETRLAVGIMFSLSRPRGRGTEKRANYSITRLRRLNMLHVTGHNSNQSSVPGTADGIDTELIAMAWRVRCRFKYSPAAAGWSIASKLMVNRGHGVLGNAPRMIGLHRHCGRYDQRCRLTRLQIIVFTMPWCLHRLVACPVISY